MRSMVGRLGMLLAAVLCAVTLALPAKAQVILRDAEMERALRELARPIIAAAGLSPNRIRIVVLKESRLNAFVLDGRTIFINSGLLLKMKRPAMLQAVLAHELAHIANGHITRRATNAKAARNTALLGLLLSAAVASVDSQAAGGLAVGSTSAAQRAFLSHTRAEESSADQSGLRYMADANIDPEGMVEVMEIFTGQEVLSRSRQDPYARTHPLSRDRLRRMRGLAAAYKETEPPDPTSVYWFNRVKEKLSAYLSKPSYTLRRLKNDNSDAARVARAWAYHKNSKTKRALAEIDALLAKRPKDPYAHELRGQILQESRNFGAAVASYKRAAALAPREPLILAGYGQALLAAGQAEAALKVLEQARARDPFNPRLMRDLGQGYAQTGRRGQASLAVAERYALQGKLSDAAIHAKRAVDLLPAGSTGSRRALDIIDAAKQQTTRRKR
ncbi:MAG: M48 family metalloprotease [Pseudomonadota bacterium]